MTDKHLYAASAPPASGQQTAREFQLEAALREIAAMTCGCHSTMNPDWHHETCFKFKAERALRGGGR